DRLAQVRPAPSDLGAGRAAAACALTRFRLERPVAAGELSEAYEAPVVLAPDVGLDHELPVVHVVDVEATRLAATLGPRLSETGRDRDRRSPAAGGDLEFVPLGDRRLVDVPGENQLGSRVYKGGKDVASPRDWFLPRAPGCADQVVVEDDDLQSAFRRGVQQLGGPPQLSGADTSRLVSPGPHRVETDDEVMLVAVDGLGRLPVPLELAER